MDLSPHDSVVVPAWFPPHTAVYTVNKYYIELLKIGQRYGLLLVLLRFKKNWIEHLSQESEKKKN